VILNNNDAPIIRLTAYNVNKDNVMNFVLSVSDGQVKDSDVVKLTVKRIVESRSRHCDSAHASDCN
jgi:hypothetical protein